MRYFVVLYISTWNFYDSTCTENAVKQHLDPFLFVPFRLISFKVSSADNAELCFYDKLLVSMSEAYILVEFLGTVTFMGFLIAPII